MRTFVGVVVWVKWYTRNLVGSAHCPLCPHQTFFMVYCFYHFKIIGSIIAECSFVSNISVAVLGTSLIFFYFLLFPSILHVTLLPKLVTQLLLFLLYLWICSLFSYFFVFTKYCWGERSDWSGSLRLSYTRICGARLLFFALSQLILLGSTSELSSSCFYPDTDQNTALIQSHILQYILINIWNWEAIFIPTITLGCIIFICSPLTHLLNRIDGESICFLRRCFVRYQSRRRVPS